jgi:hypothetical protein
MGRKVEEVAERWDDKRRTQREQRPAGFSVRVSAKRKGTVSAARDFQGADGTQVRRLNRMYRPVCGACVRMSDLRFTYARVAQRGEIVTRT